MSLLNELDFGFGMGTTEPDYEDKTIEVTINDGLQIRKPVKVKGQAHVGKLPGTDLPIISMMVHKLGDKLEYKIVWNSKQKTYNLLGNDRAVFEPENDEALNMFLKLRKKREKTSA